MGQILQENLGSKFEICSIFNPNAPLANVVEDVRKLGKDLTKQDHIVTVRGAQNSPDINQNYSSDKFLIFITERTSNTNVGFVNLFRGYDKLWMNGKVRSVNL
jgi:predicted metal-dependent enzyme (double-stranded beta helix superfamily)